MSFIHAAFLAAGLAVAIPWAIHLTRRRKYLRVRLGSLRFLEPLVRDRQRMRRVEQWPLLLLRCLAVLLLALLFSRPFLPRPATAPQGAGEFLILLDASGSITAKQADTIRKRAAGTIRSLPAGGKPVIAAVSDQVELLGSLDEYRPIAGAPSGFAAAVDWIVDRAAAAPGTSAGVHWFTDLQRAPLPAGPSRLWPSGLAAELHPVLPPSDRNLAIEQIELLTPFAADTWEIEARLRVHGVPAGGEVALTLATPDGRVLTANAPAEGGLVRFEGAGGIDGDMLTGEVAVARGGDPWPADDKRAFAFPVRSPKRIALVDGDPGGSPFLGECYFLEKALHASASGKALSPFRATIARNIPPSHDAPDVIALCNVVAPGTAEVRLLEQHLVRGCGLAIFLGDQTAPRAWSAATAAGFLPPGLRGVSDPPVAFVRHDEAGHPALGGLTRGALRGLGLVPLRRRFAWDAEAAWTSVLGFGNDEPLMAVATGRNIAVIAQSANREDSDLPLDASFVPLVQGLFHHLAEKPAGVSSEPALRSAVPGRDERRAPGIHRDGTTLTVVAADVTESDISIASEARFRDALGLPAADAPPAEIAPPPAAADSSHQREGELWPWILAVLMALLAIETMLSARRHGSTQTPSSDGIPT